MSMLILVRFQNLSEVSTEEFEVKEDIRLLPCSRRICDESFGSKLPKCYCCVTKPEIGCFLTHAECLAACPQSRVPLDTKLPDLD